MMITTLFALALLSSTLTEDKTRRSENSFFENIDGVYPHLAMSNDEGECGTGAVDPWAGSLWVVTYGLRTEMFTALKKVERVVVK